MQSCWKRSRRLALFTLIAAGVLAAQLRPFPRTAEARQSFLRQFAAAALGRTQHTVRYDPAYVRLPYPGGDVPADTGVCTDEVIRAYRAVGIDLQQEVHEDMAANFAAYPRKWGRSEPDPNIDHRRVPNLMVFFSRQGESLPITDHAEDYAPGDLVTWDLGRGLTHIGMVVDRKTLFTRRYMIVHNIGAGPKMEDVLFDWKITGHYRYVGPVAVAEHQPEILHREKFGIPAGAILTMYESNRECTVLPECCKHRTFALTFTRTTVFENRMVRYESMCGNDSNFAWDTALDEPNVIKKEVEKELSVFDFYGLKLLLGKEKVRSLTGFFNSGLGGPNFRIFIPRSSGMQNIPVYSLIPNSQELRRDPTLLRVICRVKVLASEANSQKPPSWCEGVQGTSSSAECELAHRPA